MLCIVLALWLPGLALNLGSITKLLTYSLCRILSLSPTSGNISPFIPVSPCVPHSWPGFSVPKFFWNHSWLYSCYSFLSPQTWPELKGLHLSRISAPGDAWPPGYLPHLFKSWCIIYLWCIIAVTKTVWVLLLLGSISDIICFLPLPLVFCCWVHPMLQEINNYRDF